MFFLFDWSSEKNVETWPPKHRALRFCKGPLPKEIPTEFSKITAAGLLSLRPFGGSDLEVDILNIYLRCGPLPGCNRHHQDYFIVRFGNPYLNLYLPSWEGGVTSKIYLKTSSFWHKVFYDEDNVWHFCSREEDSTCADQYSLPATLRCHWCETQKKKNEGVKGYTAPPKMNMLNPKMEVFVQMIFPFNWVILGSMLTCTLLFHI